jgi:hypothetical protein
MIIKLAKKPVIAQFLSFFEFLKIQHWKFNIENSTLKIQHWKFNIENSTLKIQHWKFNIENSTLKIQHWKFNIENSTLKIQHWKFNNWNILSSNLQRNNERFESKTLIRRVQIFEKYAHWLLLHLLGSSLVMMPPLWLWARLLFQYSPSSSPGGRTKNHFMIIEGWKLKSFVPPPLLSSTPSYLSCLIALFCHVQLRIFPHHPNIKTSSCGPTHNVCKTMWLACGRRLLWTTGQVWFITTSFSSEQLMLGHPGK